MPENRITKKHLYANALGRVGYKDWLKLANHLKLKVTTPSGGTSHCHSIWPSSSEATNIRELITTLYEGMSKQVNQKIFKKFLDRGFSENDLWKGLGLLK